jgi:hypothetical protein
VSAEAADAAVEAALFLAGAIVETVLRSFAARAEAESAQVLERDTATEKQKKNIYIYTYIYINIPQTKRSCGGVLTCLV